MESDLFGTVGYEESTTCMACEKTDKECMVIRTEAYTGPHCARCAMREAKKRAMNGSKNGKKPEHPEGWKEV